MKPQLELLAKLIKDNQTDKVYELLETISSEEDFDEHRSIINVLIDNSLCSRNYQFLKLLNHPFCHGENSDNMKYSKSSVARFLIVNQCYDLIEHTVLNGFTSMEHVSLYALSDYNLDSVKYIFDHPRLELDYNVLRNSYINLFKIKGFSFSNESYTHSLELLQSKTYHTPELINECMENSINIQSIEVAHYLLNKYPKETKIVMKDWVHYIETGKLNFKYNFRSLQSMKMNDEAKISLDCYLCELYTLLKDNVEFKNQEKIVKHFLDPFIHNSYQFDNSFALGFEFLNKVYKLDGQNVPLSMLDYVQKHPQFSFTDFDIYYDKLKLENQMSSDMNQSKKMKL